MAEIIYLTNARLSFPKIIEAVSNKNFPDQGKKFGADLILPTDSADYARFMAEVTREAMEKWKDKAGAILQMCQNDRKLRCYGKGAEKINQTTMQVYDGYQGDVVYLTSSADEDHAPKIIRPNGTTCDNPIEREQLARKMYGGCYVNAAVRPWLQDNKFGKAVRCQLIAVQFNGDGAPFGESEVELKGFGAVQNQPQQQEETPYWMK